MLAAARQMKQSMEALAQSSSRVDVAAEMWTEPPVSEEEALEQDKRAWAQRKEKAMRSMASRKSTEPSSRVDVGMEMMPEPPVSEEEALEQDKRAWAQRKEKARRSMASRKSTEP